MLCLGDVLLHPWSLVFPPSIHTNLFQALKKPKLSIPALKVGLVIEARYEGGAKFLAGKIKGVNPDGTYEVEYQNGDVEQDVKKRLIRIPGADTKTKSQIPQKYAYAMRPDELQFVPGQLKGGRRQWEHFKEWGYNINKKGEATSTVKTSRMSQPESEELRSLKLQMRVRSMVKEGCVVLCLETALKYVTNGSKWSPHTNSLKSPAGKVGA